MTVVEKNNQFILVSSNNEVLAIGNSHNDVLDNFNLQIAAQCSDLDDFIYTTNYLIEY